MSIHTEFNCVAIEAYQVRGLESGGREHAFLIRDANTTLVIRAPERREPKP